MQHCLLRKLAVLLAIFLLSAASLAADPKAVRHYEDALSRFNAGDANGAMIQLKNSLRRDPGQLPAKILLGRVYLALNNPQVAEEELVQAKKLGADPGLVAVPLARARNQLGRFQLNVDTIRPTDLPASLAGELWVELGLARMASGDVVGADIAYQEALKLDRQNVPAILGLASVQLKRKDYLQAQHYCTQALATDPENADAWFIRGVVDEVQGKSRAALEHYREALRHEPEHYKAAMGEATMLLNAGQPAQAARLFSKIVETRPWSLKAFYLQSQAYARSGQPKEAKAALESGSELVALVTPPDLENTPEQLLLAALVAFKTEQYESSFSFLEFYLRYRPEDVAARLKMAQLLILMDKPLESIRELRKLANQYPDVAEIQIQLGDANSQLGDYVAAAKNYETALSLTTPGAELVSKLGLAQQQQGRPDLAITTMSRLLDPAPGASAGASIFLGILYFDQGDFDQAGKIADQLATRHPENLLAINLQAVVAIAQENRALGRQLLETILKKNPNFEPAQINLIKLDIAEKRYAEATNALDELVAATPGNQLVARTYAALAVAENEPLRAIEILEQAHEKNPRSVETTFKLVDLYAQAGRHGEAIAILVELDHAVPNSFLVKLKLAHARLQRQEIDEARSVLLDAAGLVASNLPRRLAVAELQIRAGAFEDAAQGLQRAMIERPDAPGPRLLMARVHARQAHLAEADRLASQVVEQTPDNLAAITLLADVRLARGRTEDAIRLYRQAKQIADVPALAISLHRALVKAGRNQLALEELAEWHRKHPGNAMIMRSLANQHARMGQGMEAVALYEQLTALNPRDAEAQNNLANLLVPIDTERALKAALRAYELDPRNPAILDTLGWMQVQLGNLDNGLSLLREAVTRNGRVPDIRYHLAVALEEYGNKRAAKEQLRIALELGPPFPDREAAIQRLSRLESSGY